MGLRVIQLNLNSLDYRIAFYSLSYDGPEAGMSERVKVYECWADVYEPTQKDVQLGNLETSKKSVTLNIRNAQPQFVPHVNQVFEILNGVYKGLVFDIKNVALAKTTGYIKVVGQEQ